MASMFESNHSSLCEISGALADGWPPAVDEKSAALENLAADQVDWRNLIGLNDLKQAAIGSFGIPDFERFDYFFDQQEPSLTVEEKADGLKILGSSCILLGDFHEGLEYWRQSSLLASEPVTPLPEDAIPAVTSKLVNEPEWTDLDGEIEGSVMDQYYDSDEKKVILVYQAVLVRLRYCNQECRSDVWQICNLIRTLSVDSEAYVKLAILLFECDELYAGHSLSLDSENVYDVFFNVTHALTSRSENKYSGVEFSAHYEHLMVVLKWLTTEFQNANFFRAEIHPENLKYFDAAMMSVNDIVIAFLELWLTQEQEEDFNRCIERFGSIDWRNSEGRNLVLENCKWLSQNPSSGLYACNIKKVTQILIEEGANLDIVDNFGKNWLNYVLDGNINLFDDE